MTNAPVEISVVLPVYRAAKHLDALYARLAPALDKLTRDWEVILVEDCGGDDSWDVIQRIAAKDARVKGIKLSRNFGQHAAILCGISHACGEWIVTMDDDLEHPPEHIGDLLAKGREGYDLVYASFGERTHSAVRNLASAFVRSLFKLAIPSYYDYTSFRLIRHSVARRLTEFDSPFPFIDGYLSWVTNNYATVEVPHGKRAEGSSTYGWRKLLVFAVNIFVTFSDLPLKLATALGLVAFLGGMGWLVGIVLMKLLGGITVSGFASLMAGVILFGGLQLLILGIFGEYIGRMNFKSSGKPLFVIGRSVNLD